MTAEAQYGFQVPDPTKPDLDSSLSIVQDTVVNFIWLVNCTFTFEPGRGEADS